MGRLTKDPEVKYLQDENSTAKVTLIQGNPGKGKTSVDGESRNEKGNETGKGTEVDPGVINQTESNVLRRIRGRTTCLWDFFQNRKRCKKAAGKQIELRLVSGKKNSCVNHRIKDDIGKKLLWHWQSL